MGFSRKTLRRMPPTTRKLAKLANEAELTYKRLKRLVEEVQHLEIDSLALFEKNKAETGKKEVPDGSLEDWMQESILSKVTKGN